MIKESVWTIGDVNPKCPFKDHCQIGWFLLIGKSIFLYNYLKKKKNCVFYFCQQKDCQAMVEPSGDDVPLLVTCICG